MLKESWIREMRDKVYSHMTDIVILSLERKSCSIEDIVRSIKEVYGIKIKCYVVRRNIEELCSQEEPWIARKNGNYLLLRDNIYPGFLVFLKDRRQEIFRRTKYQIDRALINKFLDYLQNVNK